MTLNPQVEAVLAAFADMPTIDYATVTAKEMRALNDRPLAMGPRPHVDRAEDMTLPLSGGPVQARLYIAEEGGSPPPVTLFFHGGGWVVGTLETHDATCRALARSSGCAVLSVAYRLAPENPYPAGLTDCFDALKWVHANGNTLGVDGTRLAVAGDSAGGNLAAAVAIRARDAGGPALRHQLLLYPVTDRDFTRGSYAAHGAGDRFLSTEGMKWFWDRYLEGGAHNDGLATVLNASDVAGLPPATVITAEYDPLCDEGMAYAARMEEAGVPVDAAVAPGMIHSFFSLFEAIPDAQPWIDRAGARLREALA